MTLIPAHTTRTCRFRGQGTSACLFFLLVLPFLIFQSFASPDLDKTQALAQLRYGTHAAETVAAWRQMIEASRALPDLDKLTKVNTFFNRRHLFQDDVIVWQQNDYWATPLEFIGRGAGDCEDFSIAKYVTLQMLGIGNDKLRMIYVRAQSGSLKPIAHMVLGYYEEPTAEPKLLDNLISSIRPASQRPDLTPVFSFNGEGLWVGGATTSVADPTARLSRWRDVLERMRQDGL